MPMIQKLATEFEQEGENAHFLNTMAKSNKLPTLFIQLPMYRIKSAYDEIYIGKPENSEEKELRDFVFDKILEIRFRYIRYFVFDLILLFVFLLSLYIRFAELY